jgi:hypothetical protein
MTAYSTAKVIDRILQLEYSQYPLQNMSIRVTSKVVMNDKDFKTDIEISDGDKTLLLTDRTYSKEYFDDCTVDSKFDAIPLNVRYEKLMKRLLTAEMNEESLVLGNIKNHIGRINCYWKWMNAPPAEGYAQPEYYAGILSQYLDDAERYLEMLYSVG